MVVFVYQGYRDTIDTFNGKFDTLEAAENHIYQDLVKEVQEFLDTMEQKKNGTYVSEQTKTLKQIKDTFIRDMGVEYYEESLKEYEERDAELTEHALKSLEYYENTDWKGELKKVSQTPKPSIQDYPNKKMYEGYSQRYDESQGNYPYIVFDPSFVPPSKEMNAEYTLLDGIREEFKDAESFEESFITTDMSPSYIDVVVTDDAGSSFEGRLYGTMKENHSGAKKGLISYNPSTGNVVYYHKGKEFVGDVENSDMNYNAESFAAEGKIRLGKNQKKLLDEIKWGLNNNDGDYAIVRVKTNKYCDGYPPKTIDSLHEKGLIVYLDSKGNPDIGYPQIDLNPYQIEDCKNIFVKTTDLANKNAESFEAEFLYYYILNEKGESPADFDTLEEAQAYVANSSEPLEIYERRNRDDEAYKMDKKMNAETFEARDNSWCVNHGWIRGGTKVGDIIPCLNCNDMICDGCRCGGCGNCNTSDCCECSHNQAAETELDKVKHQHYKDMIALLESKNELSEMDKVKLHHYKDMLKMNAETFDADGRDMTLEEIEETYGEGRLCDHCFDGTFERGTHDDGSTYYRCWKCKQFEAESFGVEFNEWADQELMSHGKDISFKDWAEDEGMKHGDVPITDWAQHEEESHDERYGAEDNTESIKSAIMKLEKALGKMDGATYKMHDLDISAQPTTIAGFEMSRNGEKYDGGSYLIMTDGSIVNAAMGNADYGNITDNFEEMNEKIMQSFGAESIVKKYGMIAAGVITAFALLPEIKKRF